MKNPDYEGSIMWAHEALDTFGAPRKDEEGYELTVSGRIYFWMAQKQPDPDQIWIWVVSIRVEGMQQDFYFRDREKAERYLLKNNWRLYSTKAYSSYYVNDRDSQDQARLYHSELN